MGRIGTQITPKCTNCEGKHQATMFKCAPRLKAQTEAWKKKVKKSQAKNKQPATKREMEKELAIGHNRIKLDLEATG